MNSASNHIHPIPRTWIRSCTTRTTPLPTVAIARFGSVHRGPCVVRRQYPIDVVNFARGDPIIDGRERNHTIIRRRETFCKGGKEDAGATEAGVYDVREKVSASVPAYNGELSPRSLSLVSLSFLPISSFTFSSLSSHSPPLSGHVPIFVLPMLLQAGSLAASSSLASPFSRVR